MASITPSPEEQEPLFQDNNLIVENLLRQLVVSNMPMQNLCSYGWEGDCPHAFKMSQEIEDVKNRFASLKSLVDTTKA